MLKRHLTSTLILVYNDYSQPYILDTDISDTGIGAILSQEDDQGQEKVIAYASKLLN